STNETPYWSEIIDVPAGEIFAMQDAICEKIVAALAPQLTLSGPATPATKSDAYSAYLEGRFFLGRATPADAERAAKRFEAALDIDPAYGPAWAGIAECRDHLGTMGVDVADHFQAAQRAATRALALQPGLANAMNVLGRVAWQYDWDWARAEKIFEDAIRLHPGNAELRIAYSDYCALVGKSQRGIEQAERALRIDPVSPWVNTLLAQAYYMAGEIELAIRQIGRTLEFDSNFAFAHLFSGMIRMTNGEADLAVASLQRAMESGRPDFVGAYGMCLGLAGRAGDAEAVLKDILAQGDAAPAIARAVVYTGLRRYDEAAAEFAQCIADRDWHILLLYSDPLFAEAAAQPQLRRLKSKLKLP
ncbi:MAG: tetratricopeptide repeat protein, partial [Pseudomonadota bacterium]